MKKEELKQEIKSLIGRDKLKKAMQLLGQYIVDNEELDNLIIQQARYNRIKQSEANGTATKDDLNNEMNALGKHILTFVRDEDWELKIEKKETKRIEIDDFQAGMAMSLTRIKVGELLLEYYAEREAVSMRTIMKATSLKSRKLVNDFIKELETYELLIKNKKDVTVWILNEKGEKQLTKVIK